MKKSKTTLEIWFTIFLATIIAFLFASCSSLPIEHPAYKTHSQNKNMRHFMSYKRSKHRTPVAKYGYLNNPTIKKSTKHRLIADLFNF